MLQVLSESPITIGLLGGLVASILLVIWLQTAHRGPLIALIATGLVTIGLIGIERLWETDRERLIQTLYSIAATIEEKNVDELLAFIHSSAHDIRQMAAAEYNHYQLEDARVTQIWEATVLDPQHAIVKFNVIVVGGLRSGEIRDQRVARYMIVEFQKEHGDWKVLSYSHHGPHEALRREPNLPP